MRVIPQNELPKVSGGATCTYGNQNYSQGAVVSIGGGFVQQCQLGGTWSSPYKLH